MKRKCETEKQRAVLPHKRLKKDDTLSTIRKRTITVDDSLLSSFLFPLTKEDFLANFYKQKAYVSHDSPERISGLIDEYYHNLDLETLLETASSDQFHVWVKELNSQKISSFQIDDINAALVCYNAGSSLYFRASMEAEDIFVKLLSDQLGMSFASRHNDGMRRGEIEMFASNAGHVTDWYVDTI